jgi:hypothetical protein
MMNVYILPLEVKGCYISDDMDGRKEEELGTLSMNMRM